MSGISFRCKKLGQGQWTNGIFLSALALTVAEPLAKRLSQKQRVQESAMSVPARPAPNGRAWSELAGEIPLCDAARLPVRDKPLGVYLGNGLVEIDNNLVENAIRPTVVGKKNWLFMDQGQAGPRRGVVPPC